MNFGGRANGRRFLSLKGNGDRGERWVTLRSKAAASRAHSKTLSRNSMPDWPRLSRGFSLVEVLCAVLILAIALVGLTEGITTALRSNKESELQTAAALIAAGQIETLKAEGVFAEGDKDGDCGPDLPLYRWKRSITKTTIAGLDEVEVTVEQVKTGKSIYELRTMLFQPPDDTGGDGLRKRKESGRDRRGRRGGRT